MILFDRVNKRYPSGYEALKSLSFNLDFGEMAFLTGHSGAGKSTLLKMLILMEKPTSGQVLVDGQNLSRIHRNQIPYYRRNIGVVFQNHQLLFDRNVFDNVALPLLISGLQPRDIGRRVRAALDKVGLIGKEKMNPIILSGGEQQRLGIARAVVHKPKILLADEPTGNLDSKSSEEIMRLFNDLHSNGNTIILVTHENDIASHAHRTIKLLDGKIIEDKNQKI